MEAWCFDIKNDLLVVVYSQSGKRFISVRLSRQELFDVEYNFEDSEESEITSLNCRVEENSLILQMSPLNSPARIRNWNFSLDSKKKTIELFKKWDIELSRYSSSRIPTLSRKIIAITSFDYFHSIVVEKHSNLQDSVLRILSISNDGESGSFYGLLGEKREQEGLIGCNDYNFPVVVAPSREHGVVIGKGYELFTISHFGFWDMSFLSRNDFGPLKHLKILGSSRLDMDFLVACDQDGRILVANNVFYESAWTLPKMYVLPAALRGRKVLDIFMLNSTNVLFGTRSLEFGLVLEGGIVVVSYLKFFPRNVTSDLLRLIHWELYMGKLGCLIWSKESALAALAIYFIWWAPTEWNVWRRAIGTYLQSFRVMIRVIESPAPAGPGAPPPQGDFFQSLAHPQPVGREGISLRAVPPFHVRREGDEDLLLRRRRLFQGALS